MMLSDTQTAESMAPYLRQAHATFRNGFEDDDMKQIFLRNTFKEIAGSEVRFCMDKSFSFALEEMIKDLDLENVVGFLHAISSSWSELAFSPSGSHVLQTVCNQVVFGVHQTPKLLNDNVQKILSEVVSDVAKDVDDICQMMKDPNATHVFRSFLKMIGGISVANQEKSNHKEDVICKKEDLPKIFTKTLKKICSSIQCLDDKKFVETLSDCHSSPCIGCIIEVLFKRRFMKTSRIFCEKLTSALNEDSVIVLMKDKHGSHVFENLLQYGSKSSKKHIQELLFKDEKRFFDLCVHPVANFVIQRFIACVDDTENYEEVFKYICNGFEDILAGQSYGIVQNLCEQCVKFSDYQRQFYDKILEAFHCTDVKERASLVLLLATLRTHDSLFEETSEKVIDTVEYHGSVLLQTLLKFKNIGLLIKSMNSIPIKNIVFLACDSSGSHFVDSFFSSDKLKFKIKKELIEKLGEEWCQISCDKYGSRVVEKLWDSSDIAVKRLIMKSLAKNSDALSQNEFGKYVYRKVQMKRFESRQEEWETIQKQICKKRKLFADIMPEAKSRKKSAT